MTIKMQLQPKRQIQECPICGEEQPIYVRGMIRSLEDKTKSVVTHDKGYSFCNCYNVFFTKWQNIDTAIYDEEYKENYNSNYLKEFYNKYQELHFTKMKELNPEGETFLDVGCVNDYLLDLAEELGWDAMGLDVIDHDNDRIMCGSFEDFYGSKYDYLWMSHVFEHFEDPVNAVGVIKDTLNDNGIVFIAMPDPFSIDWPNLYEWGHWHVNEHHTLWDMESFILFMEEEGFECVYKKRNASGLFICNGDYHLMFRKVGNE